MYIGLTSKKMKYCPNCGAQLPDNANFCASCGSPLGAAPQGPAPEQPRQKLFSMDNFRANRQAQKQRLAKIKWWHWALIAIGVAAITMMKTGA